MARYRPPKTKLCALYAAQNGECFYCGRSIWKEGLTSRRRTAHDRDATIDHLWPKSRGHGNAGNVVLSCEQCNARKGSKQPTDAQVGKFTRLGLEGITL